MTLYGYYELDETTKSHKAYNDYQPARYPSFPKRRVAGEPKTNEYKANCREPQDQGDSDLCAQWSAVEAVDESNRLVGIGILLTFVLGALGIIATAVGTILVYRSLRQTEEALGQAREANKISLMVANADLRPWIKINTSVVSFEMTDKFCEIGVNFEIMNAGKTVAKEISIVSDCVFFKYEESFAFVDDFFKRAEHSGKPKHSLIPGAKENHAKETWRSMPKIPWQGDGISSCIFVAMVSVRYFGIEDGHPHWMQQSFFVGQDTPDLMNKMFLTKGMIGQCDSDVRVTTHKLGRMT